MKGKKTLNEKVWQVVESEKKVIDSLHFAPRMTVHEARFFSCECGHPYAAHEWDCGMIFCNRCDRRSTVNCHRLGVVREKCHTRAS